MRKRTAILLIVGSLVVMGLLHVFGFYAIFTYANPDEIFRDQSLKTSLAHIELFKLRNGAYPRKMSDLSYLGTSDQMYVRSVRYCPNSDLSAYYLGVRPSFIRTPALDLPPEFWRGTGYQPELARECR